MSQIILYAPPGAPFTIKVKAALALKKLTYELCEPQSPDDYKRWSPTGLLPAIDVDGTRVPDSARILDLLDEHFPEPPLVSEDPKVASSQRSLEAWVEATFTFYWRNYLSRLTQGDTAPRKSSKAPDAAGLGREFPQRLDDLVNFLGGRPFYYSDTVNRADLAVYSMLRRMPEVSTPALAGEIDGRTPLSEHLARVEQELGTSIE
jgi:RNA polymerase-associated protein